MKLSFYTSFHRHFCNSPAVDQCPAKLEQCPAIANDIPVELKEIPRWVNWRREMKEEAMTKVPMAAELDQAGNIMDHSNHRSFEIAFGRYQDKNLSGIGFVLDESDNILGLDCDKCIEEIDDEGNVILNESGKQFAKFWLQRGAYLEVSPSGNGLRGFVRGSLPDNMKRKSNVKGSTWEIYDKHRYLTVTGFALAVPPAQLAVISQSDIEQYQTEFMGTRSGAAQTAGGASHHQYELDLYGCDLSADDQQKISDMRMVSPEFDKFWQGDWQSIQNEDRSQKYPSQSEADLGFCNQLAKIFGEPSKVVAAWKESGLWRSDKCEGRPDYVPRTVEKAFQQLVAENRIQFLIFGRRNNGDITLRKIVPLKAAEAFLQNFGGYLRFVDSQFYNYQKDFGVWSPMDPHMIASMVQRFLEENVQPYQPTDVLSDKIVKETVSFLSRIEGVVCNSQSHVWNPKSHILVLGNGVIDLNRNQFDLQPFDHKLYSTFRSPIHYYQQAQCPNWQRFLEQVIPNKDDRLRMQEWAGYLLYPSTKLEKILFLYGSGRNGKSTFIETITSLVDPNEISHVEPQNLAREYDVAALQHKRINVVSDITTDKQTSGVFKQLVSGDRLQARNPYGRSFSFTPCVKLLFSSNFLPQTHDRSEGFYRRWDILKFDKQLKDSEVDLDLKTKLKAELPGILLWALTGLKRLKDNDWRMTVAPGFNDGIESLKQYTDVFKDFLDTYYQISGHSESAGTDQPYVRWEDLYRKYKNFCEENGLSKMSGKKVEQELMRFVCKKSQKRIGDGREGTGRAREYVVYGLTALDPNISDQNDRVLSRAA